MEILINSLEETKKLAKILASKVTGNFILLLEGDLGAGKTTFTKALAHFLGETQTVNSPTFTILKQYDKLNHIDAYRLESIEQDLGFEEIFDEEKLCVIEWAKFIQQIIPQTFLKIDITFLDDEKRLFNFSSEGLSYQRIKEEIYAEFMS